MTKVTISAESEEDTVEVLEALDGMIKRKKYKVKRKGTKGKHHIVTYIDIKRPLQK